MSKPIPAVGGSITEEQFLELREHIRLSVTEEYEIPPKILTLKGSTIATLGNFSASVGKAKKHEDNRSECNCGFISDR